MLLACGTPPPGRQSTSSKPVAPQPRLSEFCVHGTREFRAFGCAAFGHVQEVVRRRACHAGCRLQESVHGTRAA